MRTTFITLLLVLFFLPIIINSCVENKGIKAPESKLMELDSTSQYYDQNYKVYTLEGCEYIVVGYGNTRWGSHKGNCKNPIHDEKK
jgi:lipopolysaccharide export system protein LptA